MSEFTTARSDRRAKAFFNIGLAVAMIAVAGVIVRETFLSGREVIGVSAPAVFPTILTVLLVGLALALVVATLRDALPVEISKEAVSRAAGFRALLVFLITCVYVAVLETVGFHIATPAAVFLIGLACGEKRYVTLAIFTAVFSILVVVFFSQILNVPLPPGLIENWG